MSKEERKVPELRFKGFHDDWEQRKLGNVVSFYSGLTYSPKDVVSKNGVFVIRSSNIHNNSIVSADDVYVDFSVANSKHISIDDVIVVVRNGSRSLIGKHAIVKKDMVDTVIGAFMTGLQNDTPNFINALLDTEKFRNEIHKNLGATINQITTGTFKKMKFNFPENKERFKIGQLIRQLDDIITLHQRKTNTLETLRKAYLNVMFTSKSDSTPRLRFKTFTEAWEQRKLNTIVERITRKNKNNESTLPLTISAQDGLVDQNTYFNKQVASKDMSNYYLLKKGDFAYNKSYSNGFPLGTVKRLDKYDEGTLSSLYIVFRPKKVNSDFLSIYYDTNKWHREVMKLSAEGARNHGLLNIPVNSFFEKKIIIPIHEEEQLEIAKFLKRLEKIISIHQRKLHRLSKIKQVYLNKLFM